MFAEFGEQIGNLLVICNVARQDDIAIKIGGHFDDAIFDFVVNVGEGQFGAFALHCFGDAISNRAIRNKASD